MLTLCVEQNIVKLSSMNEQPEKKKGKHAVIDGPHTCRYQWFYQVPRETINAMSTFS